MATVQSNGSSAVTASSTVNNGGTAINVGTSSVLDTRALGVEDLGVFASTPIDDGNADKALSGGTFKYENQRGVIQRVTSSLAGGVANDFLTHAADDVSNADSIHSIGSISTVRLTTAIRAGNWNPYTGTFSSGPTAAVDNFYDIADADTADAANDNEASVSRSSTGEFVYKLGQPVPVQADYPAKTS